MKNVVEEFIESMAYEFCKTVLTEDGKRVNRYLTKYECQILIEFLNRNIPFDADIEYRFKLDELFDIIAQQTR